VHASLAALAARARRVPAALAVLIAAVRLRGQRALDTTARMLFATGLWTGAVTAGLRLAHLAGAEALALAAATLGSAGPADARDQPVRIITSP
jgi:hypothetical protein